MSQTTLEAPERTELPTSNDTAPAESPPVHGDGASTEGKELEVHFAALRDVLGEYGGDYAGIYLENVVRCLRRDLREQADPNDQAKRATETPEPASDDKDSVFDHPMFALPRIREIIEWSCSRLNACRVMFEAETPDGIDLPFDQGNAIDAVIRDVSDQLQHDCVETIARLCHADDLWLKQKMTERIYVGVQLDRVQRGALTRIVRVLANLTPPDLQAVHGLIEDYVAGRAGVAAADASTAPATINGREE